MKRLGEQVCDPAMTQQDEKAGGLRGRIHLCEGEEEKRVENCNQRKLSPLSRLQASSQVHESHHFFLTNVLPDWLF